MRTLILKGGLGNQLFQLSLYLFLLKKFGVNNFYIDKNTGFILDYKYQRKYELGQLSRSIKFSNSFLNFFNLLILLLKRLNPKILKLFFVEIFCDNNLKNIKVKNSKLNFKYQLFDGYFQDYFIINEVKYELFKLIKPLLKESQNDLFRSLNLRIKEAKDSIALCIRFYEETRNPSLHSNPKEKPKSIEDYNKIISILENKLDDPYFFIFVQEENLFTDGLVFNSPYEFVTHKKGYLGSWERLFSQSLCDNHVFNNSTFYYWGAFFSDLNNNKKSIIYISNNFLFKEIYNPSWKTF